MVAFSLGCSDGYRDRGFSFGAVCFAVALALMLPQPTGAITLCGQPRRASIDNRHHLRRSIEPPNTNKPSRIRDVDFSLRMANTIDYVVTDNGGLTATHTVLIEPVTAATTMQ
jgi:hypothetical protein